MTGSNITRRHNVRLDIRRLQKKRSSGLFQGQPRKPKRNWLTRRCASTTSKFMHDKTSDKSSLTSHPKATWVYFCHKSMATLLKRTRHKSPNNPLTLTLKPPSSLPFCSAYVFGGLLWRAQVSFTLNIVIDRNERVSSIHNNWAIDNLRWNIAPIIDVVRRFCHTAKARHVRCGNMN